MVFSSALILCALQSTTGGEECPHGFIKGEGIGSRESQISKKRRGMQTIERCAEECRSRGKHREHPRKCKSFVYARNLYKRNRNICTLYDRSTPASTDPERGRTFCGTNDSCEQWTISQTCVRFVGRTGCIWDDDHGKCVPACPHKKCATRAWKFDEVPQGSICSQPDYSLPSWCPTTKALDDEGKYHTWRPTRIGEDYHYCIPCEGEGNNIPDDGQQECRRPGYSETKGCPPNYIFELFKRRGEKNEPVKDFDRLSADECAGKCDELGDDCSSFVHAVAREWQNEKCLLYAQYDPTPAFTWSFEHYRLCTKD